jgi:hypothetical protein
MPFQSRCIRKLAGSPDHLICQEEQGWGYRHPERLSGLEVDDQQEFGRRLHRQVRGLRTPQDAIDIRRGPPKLVGEIYAVREQAAAAGLV